MDERETTSGGDLADADSLLGMLQRGRGKGYLAALEAPPQTVWPLLYECVTNDPRLDRLEDRVEYYASLILKTAMDLEPLQEYVRQNDNRRDSYGWKVTNFALGTLEDLADRGNRQALEILRDYAAYGHDWELITLCFDGLGVPGAMEGIGEILFRRIKGDSQIHAQFLSRIEEDWSRYCRQDEETRRRCGFLLPICEPWKSLCEQNSELADLFAGVGIAYDRPVPPREKPSEEYLAGLSLEDLFSQVDKSNCIRFWRVLPEKVSMEHEDYLLRQLATGDPCYTILAHRGLGKLGTPRAFEALRSYIETSENADSKVRRYAFQAIGQIPGRLTLETARQWWRRQEWYLQVAGGGILENHATPDDVPLLLEALRMPEAIRREDRRLPSALDALARLDGIGPIPEVEQVFCQVQHSFDRCRAADAMAATAPTHFTAEYAFECLWDCHWNTRGLGCEMVSLSMPGALERLRELAQDPNEIDPVRWPARERLEDF